MILLIEWWAWFVRAEAILDEARKGFAQASQLDPFDLGTQNNSHCSCGQMVVYAVPMFGIVVARVLYVVLLILLLVCCRVVCLMLGIVIVCCQ